MVRLCARALIQSKKCACRLNKNHKVQQKWIHTIQFVCKKWCPTCTLWAPTPALRITSIKQYQLTNTTYQTFNLGFPPYVIANLTSRQTSSDAWALSPSGSQNPQAQNNVPCVLLKGWSQAITSIATDAKQEHQSQEWIVQCMHLKDTDPTVCTIRSGRGALLRLGKRLKTELLCCYMECCIFLLEPEITWLISTPSRGSVRDFQS